MDLQSGPVSIQDMFDVSMLNNLWAMLAGNQFSLSDRRLRHLLNLLRESFHQLDMSGGLLNQLPWLRHVAPDHSGFRQIVHMLNSILDFMQETVKEHQSTLKPGVIRDFIDAFLHEMEENNLKNCSSFTEKQLLVLLMDMFMAGSETTSNTLAFATLFLLQHPDVLELAVKELDSVVEHGKLPSLKDRPRLTFIEAIILETQRLANVAPVTPPHRAKRKTTLNGYTIPKIVPIILLNTFTVSPVCETGGAFHVSEIGTTGVRLPPPRSVAVNRSLLSRF
ncbi:hypothetical protein J6590_001830 [Homalodisca vitripennis]|nr:hypothetical protein J6590_001830 [Homalodisca vitripennis]